MIVVDCWDESLLDHTQVIPRRSSRIDRPFIDFSQKPSEYFIKVYKVQKKVQWYIRLKPCLYIELHYGRSYHRWYFLWLVFSLTFYLGSHLSSVQLGAKLAFHVTSNCLSHISICLKFKARVSAKRNIRRNKTRYWRFYAPNVISLNIFTRFSMRT